MIVFSTENMLQQKKMRGRGHPLSPLRPVIVITPKGPTEFSVGEISVEKIGRKAYGLSSLPSDWVPPFFVITASCFEGECSNKTIDAYVSECFIRAGISTSGLVIVRSSGTSETMQYRGRLKSASCPSNQATMMIRSLIPQLPHMPGGKVHWIIQEYVQQRRMGHLSNERHLRMEKRDWIVGFDTQEDIKGFTVPIAVRFWRDGKDLPGLDLSCTSEYAAPLCLKLVALWATQLSSRIHFEWVWGGKVIKIVQADEVEPAIGIKPRSLLPKRISPIKSLSLQVFRMARDIDFENYRKLCNAKLYQELGYEMPVFYILDDPKLIDNVMSGLISSELESDLYELTKRPLVIRTDGIIIHRNKYQMLPRTDEVRSFESAKEWLFNKFKAHIQQHELKGSKLALICHHFIPSAASAWARAVPGQRIVRIDSLWGIPEGLYYFSHDTFEIDTKEVDLDNNTSNYECVGERLRYKENFIAPDENGKWIWHKTIPPFDWTKSIRIRKWLFEIAYKTRQIAEHEGYAVSIMWFIDNHPQATRHKVLPWFHSQSDISSPNAAPKRKLSSALDFKIKTEHDWQRLIQDLESGKSFERIIVEPEDPELIRNFGFAERLAGLAKEKDFVVVLSGSILSHPYYILQGEGAKVECIDFYGVDEDVDDYNKIVRDGIPDFIERRGERAQTIQLTGDALVTALQQKLVEEAFEALDAKSGQDLLSELADVQEVIRALCVALGQSIAEIEVERGKKTKNRGGFEKGLMLIKTATPHSMQKQPLATNPPSLGLMQQSSDLVISDASKIPARPVYRRADLRKLNEQLEKLFVFETELNKGKNIEESLDFPMPLANQQQQKFNLKVELKRTRSSIRVIVRLRRPLQLQFDFSK